MAHPFLVAGVNVRLSFAHGLEAVSRRDGRLTVGRSNADIKGNKAISTHRASKHISRAGARRSGKKTKSLFLGMWIATTGERQ